MFSLPIMEPSLSFTNVKIITISTTSFVNDFGSLRAIKTVLIWKERFNMAGVLKNYLQIQLTPSKTGKYRILGV